MSWLITDFAEKQSHYTGATNKRKWVIKDFKKLSQYFEECEFKPALLKNKLNTSYATIKRLLCSAGLWDKAVVKLNNKGGRKRTTLIDKFGYKYADAKYDIINDRGEIIRRYEHHVVAEEKVGRKLKDSEVVHHIDLNKTNNNSKNLLVCDNNSHHRKLHGNLEKVAGLAVELGIIKFDDKKGYYLNESN